MARRLGSEVGKSVALTADSAVSELPFLGEIRSAVIHLVRNAIDHGIEDEYERVSLRKPPAGNIRVSVSGDGRDYLIEVGDDGRGIDFERVSARAREAGLIASGQDPDRAALVKLLFLPDFSCSQGSALSGRGYGLDIVREAVVRLGGRVSVATRKGAGTRFRIRVPAGARPAAVAAGAAGREGQRP
jgi:chemotaxis protein histidine kinase CheA